MNEVKVKNKSINNYLYDKNKKNSKKISNSKFSNDYNREIQKSSTSKRSSLGSLLYIGLNLSGFSSHMKTSKLSHKHSSITQNMHNPAKKRISERKREEENQKTSENSNGPIIAKAEKIKLRHNRLKVQMNKRIPTNPYFNKNSQSIKRPLSKKTPINNGYSTRPVKKQKANTVSVNKKTQSRYLDIISNKSKMNQAKKNSFKVKKKPIYPNKITKRVTNSHKPINSRTGNKNFNPVSKSQQKKIEPYLNTNKNLRQTKLREERKKISELELKNKNQKNKYKFKIKKKKTSPKSEVKSFGTKIKPQTGQFYNDILFKQSKNSTKKSERLDLDKQSKVASSSLNKNFNFTEKYQRDSNKMKFNHNNKSARKYKFREPSDRSHSIRKPTEIKEFERALEAIEGTIKSIPSIRKSGLRAKTQKSLSKKINKFNNLHNKTNQINISKDPLNEIQVYYKSLPKCKEFI